MGYRAIQVEWVKEEGKSIRNLLEVAVMEGSCVVFPMNDLAQVDTVKRFWPGYSAKGSASGKTRGRLQIALPVGMQGKRKKTFKPGPEMTRAKWRSASSGCP